jgi:hypothetical protein
MKAVKTNTRRLKLNERFTFDGTVLYNWRWHVPALARTMDSPQNHSILLKMALVWSRLAASVTEVTPAEPD